MSLLDILRIKTMWFGDCLANRRKINYGPVKANFKIDGLRIVGNHVKKGVGQARATNGVAKCFSALSLHPLRIYDDFYDSIQSANNLMNYVKQIPRASNIKKVRRVHGGETIRIKAINEQRGLYDTFIGPLVKDYKIRNKITELPEMYEFSGNESEFKGMLFDQTFLLMWSSLEEYLHRRVTKQVFRSKESCIDFVKNITDFPTTWSDTEEKIKPWEYSEKLAEIVDQYLTFSYHSIDKKVAKVYRSAFNIDLMKFDDKAKLFKYREKRHKLVHSSQSMFGRYAPVMNERRVREFGKVALNFAEYIEIEIDKNMASGKIQKYDMENLPKFLKEIC